MTSKEALKYLLADSELLYCEHEEDIKFYLEAEKEYNIVLKDLNRLEELEKNIIEQRKIVLLTKDMIYFDTFTEKYFLDFLGFLIDNEVYCHIDTIYGLTEVWLSNCGKRKLHKLIIKFNSKEGNSK